MRNPFRSSSVLVAALLLVTALFGSDVVSAEPAGAAVVKGRPAADRSPTSVRRSTRQRSSASARRNRRTYRSRATRSATRSRSRTRARAGAARRRAVPTGDVWARLRQCESGGRYKINTGNGFYGAYQFHPRTWRSLGYSGLPHRAPPEVQDEAARKLQARSGWGQWPACSRRLGLR